MKPEKHSINVFNNGDEIKFLKTEEFRDLISIAGEKYTKAMACSPEGVNTIFIPREWEHHVEKQFIENAMPYHDMRLLKLFNCRIVYLEGIKDFGFSFLEWVD